MTWSELTWWVARKRAKLSLCEAAMASGPVSDAPLGRFADGAQAIAVPGHTPGSVALYLSGPRVLFTGDAMARRPDGQVISGVFNVDRARALASFRRLTALNAKVACFGHGEPLTQNAAAAFRAAAAHQPS